MADTWDKAAIKQCPGCGAGVRDARADNVVVMECGAEVWRDGAFTPTLACHERRIAEQARQLADLQHTVAGLAEREAARQGWVRPAVVPMPDPNWGPTMGPPKSYQPPLPAPPAMDLTRVGQMDDGTVLVAATGAINFGRLSTIDFPLLPVSTPEEIIVRLPVDEPAAGGLPREDDATPGTLPKTGDER